MIILLFLMSCVILGSACLSVIETAFLSLPLMRARMMVEQDKPNAKKVLWIKQNIHPTVASIVVVNNIINISGSVIIGQQVATIFGEAGFWVTVAVFPLLVIVLGEVIPKTLGERYKVRVAAITAPPVYALVSLLGPLVRVVLSFEKWISRHHKVSPMPKVTEEEIKVLLKIGRDVGTVEGDEEILINRVFKLNDVRAKQIMKPIDKIYAIAADQTLQEAKDAVINSPFSRIAVYDKDPNDIIGMAQHRILLREIAKDNYQATVREFIFEPIFVHQWMKADTLLEKFQQTHQHMFIVQDNIGNDIGIVTMEDVLEELFGEIYDEKDIRPKMMKEMAHDPKDNQDV